MTYTTVLLDKDYTTVYLYVTMILSLYTIPLHYGISLCYYDIKS